MRSPACARVARRSPPCTITTTWRSCLPWRRCSICRPPMAPAPSTPTGLRNGMPLRPVPEMGADGVKGPWFAYIHQLVPSIAAAADFYRNKMGMRPTDDGPLGAPLTLGDGQGGYGLRLVLAERPQTGWQADWLAQHGPGID